VKIEKFLLFKVKLESNFSSASPINRVSSLDFIFTQSWITTHGLSKRFCWPACTLFCWIIKK